MGLHKNTFNLGGGFNIGAAAPIDSRMLLDTVADLTTGSTWDPSSTPIYKGLTVTIKDTGDIYVCIDEEQFETLETGWKKIGGGGLSAVTWGEITGDITSQSDLMTLIGGKLDISTSPNTVYGVDQDGNQVQYQLGGNMEISGDTIDAAFIKVGNDEIESLFENDGE